MGIKELLLDKDFTSSRISALIAIVILSSLSIISVIIPFVNKYIQEPLLDMGIFAVIELSIAGIWYYRRTVFPKGNPNKQNIVIAITTEDTSQKARIRKDFSEEIKKQLKKNRLDSSYDVIILHNHLSKLTKEKIELWSQSQKAGMPDSEDVISFNKITNKLNAKFFIFGDLIKRNTTDSTYCLSVEALILHAQTNLANGITMKKEFNDLWKKEITFLENDELVGFKSNAEDIFFTATYMLGLATFVDNQFELGANIWSTLQQHVEITANLSKFTEKIKKLHATSLFLQSRLHYFAGNFEDAVKWRKLFLSITPNEYDAHLNQAIEHVKLRNDPELALEHVEIAEKLAQNDQIWRYSKLYLYIKLGRIKDGLVILDAILSNKFPSDIDVVNQVIAYNINCLKDDSKHLQTNFIVGTLLYKKLDHPIPAYEKLESFISSTEDIEEWKPMRELAQTYLSEIDKIIKV